MSEVRVSFGSPCMGFVARRLVTPWQRLRGLLLTGRGARAVLLERCGSIHTLGMGYPIDVAFLARDGTCLLSVRGVVPGRVVAARGATRVLERPEAMGPWPRQGERVRIVPARRCPRAGPGGDRR